MKPLLDAASVTALLGISRAAAYREMKKMQHVVIGVRSLREDVHHHVEVRSTHMRTTRTKKPLERRLASLEDELYLLRCALDGLKTDQAHLRTLATHLRLLVCKSSGTDGLIYRLARELAVSDVVAVHHSGQVNPDHPLARGLRIALSFLQRPACQPSPSLPPVDSYSLQELIRNGQAAWVLGMKSLTHEALIKAVAQQIGSAHEDDGIEPGLLDLEDILIQNSSAYVPILATTADLMLEVGERILSAAEATAGFQRRRFSSPLSLTLALRVRERLVGSIPLTTFAAPRSNVMVDVRMFPLSVSPPSLR